MNNRLMEKLEARVDEIDSRRYSLSDIISESYRALYQCEKDTNLYKLVESHLDEVRKNPSDIDRLSHQLSVIKEAIRMKKSGRLRDSELVLSNPKPRQRKITEKRTVRIKEGNNVSDKLPGSIDNFLQDLAQVYDYFDYKQIMDHNYTPDEIRQLRKYRVRFLDIEDEYEEDAPELLDIVKGVAAIVTSTGKKVDLAKKPVEESSSCTNGKEGESCKEAPASKKNTHIRKRNADEQCNKGINEDDDPELTDDEVEELAKHLETIRKERKNTTTSAPEKEMTETTKGRKLARKTEGCNSKKKIAETLDNGKTDSRESVVLDNIFSWMRDQYSEEEFVHLCKKKFNMTDEELSTFCDVNESKRVSESATYDKKSLYDFKKKSSSKAFMRTFKKLDSKLKEGTALTRQESIDLYKASNSALTHLSVELEHNPKFLNTFKESVNILSKDVQDVLGSLTENKAPSKKTMKSLSKFSESLLDSKKIVGYDLEGATDIPKVGEDFRVGRNVGKCVKIENGKAYMEIDDAPLEEDDDPSKDINIEDEEFIGDDEGDLETELSPEAEEFYQDYADAREKLHQDMKDKYDNEESEEEVDPQVAQALEQDAEEVAALKGDDEEEDEETPGEDQADENGEGAEYSEDDITDDELAELKKHLTEMRKNRKK